MTFSKLYYMKLYKSFSNPSKSHILRFTMWCPRDEVNNSSKPIMSSNRRRLWSGSFTRLTDVSLMMEPASPLQPLTNSLSLLWVYACTASEIPLSNYLSPGLSVQAFICFAWPDAHEKLAWALSGWYLHFKMWRVLYNILCMLWSSTQAYAFDL